MTEGRATYDGQHLQQNDQFEVRDERIYPYFTVENSVIDHWARVIGVDGLAVYCLLSRYAGHASTCYPSQETVADKLGISRARAGRAMKLLSDAGLIRRSHQFRADGGRMNDLITLCNIPPHPGSYQGVSNDSLQGVSNDSYTSPGYQNVTAKENTVTKKQTLSSPEPLQQTVGGTSNGGEKREESVWTENGKNLRKKTAHPLPDDFNLTDERLQYALSKSLSNERAELEFESFVDYYSKPGAKQHSDYDAAWRTWVRNEIKWNAAHNAEQQQPRRQWVEGNGWLVFGGAGRESGI